MQSRTDFAFLFLHTPMNATPRSLSLLFATLLALFSACGPDDGTVRLEGKIEGIDQADLLLVSGEGSNANPRLDTIKVVRGEFSHDRPLDSPTLLTLVYPNLSTTTLVAEPGQTLRIRAHANRLKEVEIGGSESNALLNEFRHRMLKKPPTDARREAATFVRTHPESMAAVAVFRDYFDTVEQRTEQPSLDLLELLRKHHPDNPLVRALHKRLRPQLLTARGGRLPAFSATDLEGKNIDNAQLKGRPAFIVFLAPWESEVHETLLHLKHLRRTTGRRLTIVTVAFDTDTTGSPLRQFVRTDTLRNVICERQALASPLAATLGVRYVPGCLLVDANGKIIDRDLPSAQWEERIPALLHGAEKNRR